MFVCHLVRARIGPRTENWTVPLPGRDAGDRDRRGVMAADRPGADRGRPAIDALLRSRARAQVPKPPRTKSFSVAVVDVDDLVGRHRREALVAEAERGQVDPALEELAVERPLFRRPTLSSERPPMIVVGLTIRRTGRSRMRCRSWRWSAVALIRRFPSPHAPTVSPVVFLQVASTHTVIDEVVPPLLSR